MSAANAPRAVPVPSRATAGADEARSIRRLDAQVAALPAEERVRFERIYHLDVTTGRVAPPETMRPWIGKHFGSVEAVVQQRILKVTNRVTLEGALFNALRAQRPLQAPPSSEGPEKRVEDRAGCDFCRPLERTPADAFGRTRGRSAITASNVAKYDGWHAVLVFDEHHPLRFTADQVADYVETAEAWAHTAQQADPEACYPLFLWNCLWRSGASILHGHAQMVLTRGMHYAKVEGWRQAALRYRAAQGRNYFDDLLAVHGVLGLAVDHGAATILPSLTPFKEKETHIIAPRLDGDLKSALFRVLSTFIERLGVQSFNLALYLPPLAETPEEWDGFPFVVRLLDRGDPRSRTSDVGAMEFFAQSVVSTDPFRVADALRATSPDLGSTNEQGEGDLS
jgi:hypothetical protein